MPVDNSRAVQRTNDFIEALQARLKEALPDLLEELQADVLAKTPTPEEEYLTLMVGDGGAAYNVPPLAGNQSADHDTDEPGRVRFRKIGLFMRDLVTVPANYQVTENSISIGNHDFLLANSFFEFCDYVPKKKPKPGVTYDGDFHPVGPYFDAFQFGTGDFSAWTVTTRGDRYPLRPDDDPAHRPQTMFKPIVRRLMYYPVDLEVISRRFLDGILENDGPQ